MTGIILLIAVLVVPGFIGSFVGGYLIGKKKPRRSRKPFVPREGPRLYEKVKAKKTPRAKNESELYFEELKKEKPID